MVDCPQWMLIKQRNLSNHHSKWSRRVEKRLIKIHVIKFLQPLLWQREVYSILFLLLLAEWSHKSVLKLSLANLAPWISCFISMLWNYYQSCLKRRKRRINNKVIKKLVGMKKIKISQLRRVKRAIKTNRTSKWRKMINNQTKNKIKNLLIT